MPQTGRLRVTNMLFVDQVRIIRQCFSPHAPGVRAHLLEAGRERGRGSFYEAKRSGGMLMDVTMPGPLFARI